VSAQGPRVDILTIFPDLVRPFLEASVLGAAIQEGRLDVRVTDLRDFTTDRHRTVDDTPYGGGDGMVLKCDPVVPAVEAMRQPGGRVLLLSPRGRRLDQALARELARESQLVLVSGRYGGFDERIACITGAEELSVGDYVLSGGELAALVVTEVVTRLVPGVLGNPLSAEIDSFTEGLLEYPLYTRPREFRSHAVPEILLSGDHAAVERWRREQALRLTQRRRPDLLPRASLSDDDRKTLKELENEGDRGHP
jgi:tRNA (guanine37-N1)-methyltransferase